MCKFGARGKVTLQETVQWSQRPREQIFGEDKHKKRKRKRKRKKKKKKKKKKSMNANEVHNFDANVDKLLNIIASCKVAAVYTDDCDVRIALYLLNV